MFSSITDFIWFPRTPPMMALSQLPGVPKIQDQSANKALKKKLPLQYHLGTPTSTCLALPPLWRAKMTSIYQLVLGFTPEFKQHYCSLGGLVLSFLSSYSYACMALNHKSRTVKAVAVFSTVFLCLYFYVNWSYPSE